MSDSAGVSQGGALSSTVDQSRSMNPFGADGALANQLKWGMMDKLGISGLFGLQQPTQNQGTTQQSGLSGAGANRGYN